MWTAEENHQTFLECRVDSEEWNHLLHSSFIYLSISWAGRRWSRGNWRREWLCSNNTQLGCKYFAVGDVFPDTSVRCQLIAPGDRMYARISDCKSQWHLPLVLQSLGYNLLLSSPSHHHSTTLPLSVLCIITRTSHFALESMDRLNVLENLVVDVK